MCRSSLNFYSVFVIYSYNKAIFNYKFLLFGYVILNFKVLLCYIIKQFKISFSKIDESTNYGRISPYAQLLCLEPSEGGRKKLVI